MGKKCLLEKNETRIKKGREILPGTTACVRKVLGQESRGEAEKQGNGASVTTASMKVCRQSCSKESWECRVQAT